MKNQARWTAWSLAVALLIPGSGFSQAPDFTWTCRRWRVPVARGAGALVDCTLTPVNDFAGPVTLGCAKEPSGVSCAFNPTVVPLPAGTPDGSASISWEVRAATNTALGTYPLTVTATSDSLVHTINAQVLVTSVPDCPGNPWSFGSYDMFAWPCVSNNEFIRFVNNMADAGFRGFRTMLNLYSIDFAPCGSGSVGNELQPYRRSNICANQTCGTRTYYNICKFDLTQWNDVYWQRVREIVKAMLIRGYRKIMFTIQGGEGNCFNPWSWNIQHIHAGGTSAGYTEWMSRWQTNNLNCCESGHSNCPASDCKTWVKNEYQRLVDKLKQTVVQAGEEAGVPDALDRLVIEIFNESIRGTPGSDVWNSVISAHEDLLPVVDPYCGNGVCEEGEDDTCNDCASGEIGMVRAKKQVSINGILSDITEQRNFFNTAWKNLIASTDFWALHDVRDDQINDIPFDKFFSGKLEISTDGLKCPGGQQTSITGLCPLPRPGEPCRNQNYPHCRADEVLSAAIQRARAAGFDNLNPPFYFEHDLGAIVQNGRICLPRDWPTDELYGIGTGSIPGLTCSCRMGCYDNEDTPPGIQALYTDEVCDYGITLGRSLLYGVTETQAAPFTVWSFHTPDNASVNVDCVNSPGDVSCGFVSGTLPAGGRFDDSIPVTLAEGNPAGSYRFQIQAAVGNRAHTAPVEVADFTVACEPNPITMDAGSSGNVTCSLTSYHYTGTVTVGCGNPPQGITCTPAQQEISLAENGTATVVLQVHVSGEVQGDTYDLVVTAADPLVHPPAGLSHEDLVQVRVADFEVDCNPVVGAPLGDQTVKSCSVTSRNGWTGVVDLALKAAFPSSRMHGTILPGRILLDEENTKVDVDLVLDLETCDPAYGGIMILGTVEARGTKNPSYVIVRTVPIHLYLLDFTLKCPGTLVEIPESCWASYCVVGLGDVPATAGGMPVYLSSTGCSQDLVCWTRVNPVLPPASGILSIKALQPGVLATVAVEGVHTGRYCKLSHTAVFDVRAVNAPEVGLTCGVPAPFGFTLPLQASDAGLCTVQARNICPTGSAGGSGGCGTVTAACANVPDGLRCATLVSRPPPGMDPTVAIWVQTDIFAPDGVYRLAAEAEVLTCAGKRSVSYAFPVTVDSSMVTFALECAPQEYEIPPGGIGEGLCTLTPYNRFTDPGVVLECKGNPAGLKCGYNPPVVPVTGTEPPATSVLTLGATKSLLAGRYVFLAQGTATGGPTRQAGIGARVVEVGVPGLPTEPPECDHAYVDPDGVWPPNHEMTPFIIRGVTDPEGEPVWVQVTSIFQDEPVDGDGDGDTAPDAVLNPPQVRAERRGGGDGRVYHVKFTAVDASGNGCTGEVRICVPHDRGGGGSCADGGALYDSTAG